MFRLAQLKIKDRPEIEKYLSLNEHRLSVYSFENIYLWKCLYEIFYSRINDNFCIFFRDKRSCFMNVMPLGENTSLEVLDKCFKIMDTFNKNMELSRIENVEDGFSCRDALQCVSTGMPQYFLEPKFEEYLYLRNSLVELKGDKFKSKRSSLNYFLKNYNYEFLPFDVKFTNAALDLYKEWAQMRKAKFEKDDCYCLMIDDSSLLHKFLMQNFKKLKLCGFVVKVENEIRAYTFGYPLNKNTFCIFTEIADLEIKGLSQFIFWQFCKEIEEFKFINTMDDSGLTNLKRVKLSYHPDKLLKSFILKRNVKLQDRGY